MNFLGFQIAINVIACHQIDFSLTCMMGLRKSQSLAPDFETCNIYPTKAKSLLNFNVHTPNLHRKCEAQNRAGKEIHSSPAKDDQVLVKSRL